MRLKKTILILLVLVLAGLLLRYALLGRPADPLADQNDPAVQPEQPSSSGEEETPVISRYTAALGTIAAGESGGVVISYDDGRESVSFPDVSVDDWYITALNFVISNDLMTGTTADGGAHMEFRPDYGMTKEQLAVLLCRFAGGGETAPVHEFSDVAEGNWYYSGVNWADAYNVLDGNDDGSFGVGAFLSCSETLTAFYRLAGSPKNETALSTDYPYASKVDEQALPATIWAWNLGLIEETDCVWYPTQAISRAQVALLLLRYDRMVGFPSA